MTSIMPLLNRRMIRMCSFGKSSVRSVGETWAEELTVYYGGSVEPGNAAAFFGQEGIDGVLIGGASLKADEFLAIVNAGIRETEAEMQPT